MDGSSNGDAPIEAVMEIIGEGEVISGTARYLTAGFNINPVAAEVLSAQLFAEGFPGTDHHEQLYMGYLVESGIKSTKLAQTLSKLCSGIETANTAGADFGGLIAHVDETAQKGSARIDRGLLFRNDLRTVVLMNFGGLDSRTRNALIEAIQTEEYTISTGNVSTRLTTNTGLIGFTDAPEELPEENIQGAVLANVSPDRSLTASLDLVLPIQRYENGIEVGDVPEFNVLQTVIEDFTGGEDVTVTDSAYARANEFANHLGEISEVYARNLPRELVVDAETILRISLAYAQADTMPEVGASHVEGAINLIRAVYSECYSFDSFASRTAVNPYTDVTQRDTDTELMREQEAPDSNRVAEAIMDGIELVREENDRAKTADIIAVCDVFYGIDEVEVRSHLRTLADEVQYEYDGVVLSESEVNIDRESVRVYGIIQEAEESASGGAPIALVMDEVEKENLTREEVSACIEQLKSANEIYEPQDGYIHTN